MIFRPPDDASAPALIFLHERYGLTKHTLDLAQKAARAGFVGVAPDLFTRWQGDRDALRAGSLRVTLPDGEVAAVVHETIDELKTDPHVDAERIVLIGVCQSGRYAVVVGSERTDLAACVVLYGAAQESDWQVTKEQPRPMPEMIGALRAPFLFLFGEGDHVISLADVRRVRGAFEDARKSYRMRVFAGMPHGWLNDTMPGRYRPAEAAAAWDMLVEFANDVFAGAWPRERVRWDFGAETSPTYDFGKNVRYE